MLSELEIERFRGFEQIRVPDLARVNLIVGANGVGKTSLLEAVEILERDSNAIWSVPMRRREFVLPESGSALADVRHLFYGHVFEVGASFSLRGRGPHGEQTLTCKLVESRSIDLRRGPLIAPLDIGAAGASVLTLQVERPGDAELMEVGPDGRMDRYHRADRNPAKVDTPVRFVGPGEADFRYLVQLWDGVALKPEEVSVVDALRIIEPRLERLASGGTGMRAKLKGFDQPVPLASMGDGTMRMLHLSLELVASAGGFLLVDEIGTGLHYSVMERMWRLVLATARRLDVQVFATTHSDDCVAALANVAEKEPELAVEIALHRLLRAPTRASRFSAEDLVIASRHRMELR
jgi:hypothetical protein